MDTHSPITTPEILTTHAQEILQTYATRYRTAISEHVCDTQDDLPPDVDQELEHEITDNLKAEHGVTIHGRGRGRITFSPPAKWCRPTTTITADELVIKLSKTENPLDSPPNHGPYQNFYEACMWLTAVHYNETAAVPPTDRLAKIYEIQPKASPDWVLMEEVNTFDGTSVPAQLATSGKEALSDLIDQTDYWIEPDDSNIGFSTRVDQCVFADYGTPIHHSNRGNRR